MVTLNLSTDFFGQYNYYNFPLAYASSDLIEAPKQQAIEKYKIQFCGIDSKPNSNSYVTEYGLNNECEMPLAITVGKTGLWYISTKLGHLVSYNTTDQTFTKYDIPIWASRENPIDSSQVWDIKSDPSGNNLWFTDEKQNMIWKFDTNTKLFEHFKIPETSSSFGTIYPVSIDFDNNGNIYLLGIWSHSLWIGNINLMKSGTSEGIENIPIPLEGFIGVDPNLINGGSIVVDRINNNVWFSVLSFGNKGQIFKYEINNKSFESYDIDLPSPVGMTLDEKGNLWVSDHGTSIFFRLNSTDGSLTKFVTSAVSDRIFGGQKINGQAYSLPYWMKTGFNGSIVFNEHTGNKIAKFYPDSMMLVEYWIPTQNKLFGQCSSDLPTNTCGIGNVLQLTPEYNNTIWFTEWSENKIGKIKTNLSLPFTISNFDKQITIPRGESKEIKLQVTSNSYSTASLISSSSFTETGGLGTSFGLFNEKSLVLKPGDSKQISYVLTVSNDVPLGNHIIMLGAENDSISVSKAIIINVI